MTTLTRFLSLIILITITTNPVIASAKTAESFITSLGEEVLQIASNKGLNTTQKEQKISSMFKKNIDFQWIGGFVLGKHKRSASTEQITRYNKAYEGFIVRSYGSRFKDYAGETFKIISSAPQGAGKHLVKTEIIRPAESNILVDYKVKKAGSSFKVYDIIVEGVSLITTQRSEFNSVINRKDLNTLISALEKKAGA